MTQPGCWRGVVAAALLMTVAIGAGSADAQPSSAPAAGIQGLWRSGDATIRIVIGKGQARATMTQVGQGARTLGFKPGDLSFVATVDGNYLWGQQRIRYAGSCHPNGRKVPMMGRLTPDGLALALHNYEILIDANCRDTGDYSVSETIWQRVPSR